MPISNKKIVQSFITAVKEIADLVVAADTKAQAYKAKWVALNPDLTGTNLTAAQVTAVNAWITALHAVATDPVVTIANSKYIASHDTKGLD